MNVNEAPKRLLVWRSGEGGEQFISACSAPVSNDIDRRIGQIIHAAKEATARILGPHAPGRDKQMRG